MVDVPYLKKRGISGFEHSYLSISNIEPNFKKFMGDGFIPGIPIEHAMEIT
jgi:hypothetical protein